MVPQPGKVIEARLWKFRSKRALRNILETDADPSQLNDWEASLVDPTEFYLNYVRFFHSLAFPAELKRHRHYFSEERRGFGEDAFHVMWWNLFKRLRPANFLEIGVYRGQTLSLAALLQRILCIEGAVTGISPFSSDGDSVSLYRADIDYLEDTKKNFRAFGLPSPTLRKAFSTDPVAIELIRSRKWEAIYIDGNHDYEVAKADWVICSEQVQPGGIVVMDDAALNTTYAPPLFATAGHAGPSRVTSEIDSTKFRELLRVGHNRVFQRL